MSPLRPALAASLAVLALACSKQPAEIASTAAPTSAPAPAVEPLRWAVPPTWTVLDQPKMGPRKASYKADKAGADKEDATVDVMFFGTGAKGDVEKNFKEWYGQFDGDVGATAKREKLAAASGLEVELVETTAPSTFKVALTPPVGPKKQPPVQMVKNGWRMRGAAVKTPDRGTWFFRMVGPDETVQAAKSAFRALVDSAR